MKILIDENLPSRLPRQLADLFPLMQHARELGLAGTPDEEVWEFANAHDYAVILTTDADFQDKVLGLGPPPKIIRIERCDFSAKEIIELLRREAIRITNFLASPLPLLLLRR